MQVYTLLEQATEKMRETFPRQLQPDLEVNEKSFSKFGKDKDKAESTALDLMLKDHSRFVLGIFFFFLKIFEI